MPVETTDAPKPLRRGANFLDGIWYCVSALEWLILEARNTRLVLGELKQMTETFQSDLDANSNATQAALAAIATEVSQLATAVAAIPVGEVVTQAMKDQLKASTDSLTAATATLTADDPAV